MCNLNSVGKIYKTKQAIYVLIQQIYRLKGEHHLELRNLKEEMLYQSLTKISFYKKIDYEALDCKANVITDRSDQQDFKTYINLENFLI